MCYCKLKISIFVFKNKCSFDLTQNKTEYRTMLVSKSLPVEN